MYSFVIPVKDEAHVIPMLYERLVAVLARLNDTAELIFIDDGSTDQSATLLRNLTDHDERCRLVTLSRNFGHQVAISAGLDHANGDAVIIMDADLQDPPEVALQMIEAWKQGAEIVHGVRTYRNGESLLKKVSAKVYYRILRSIGELRFPVDSGDFRLIDRKVVLAFRSMSERNRYVRGMFAWIGFRQVAVTFERCPRAGGETKFTWQKMIKFALDGLFSFSTAPAQAILSVATICLFAGIALMFKSLTPGMVLMCCGVQLFAIGIVAQYLIRAASEVRGRPLYVISEKHGFSGGK